MSPINNGRIIEAFYKDRKALSLTKRSGRLQHEQVAWGQANGPPLVHLIIIARTSFDSSSSKDSTSSPTSRGLSGRPTWSFGPLTTTTDRGRASPSDRSRRQSPTATSPVRKTPSCRRQLREEASRVWVHRRQERLRWIPATGSTAAATPARPARAARAIVLSFMVQSG